MVYRTTMRVFFAAIVALASLTGIRGVSGQAPVFPVARWPALPALGAVPLAAVRRLRLAPVVRLDGSVSPLVRGARVLGPLDGQTTMTVVIAFRLRNGALERRFLHDLYHAGSPVYHHFLRPGEFARRFGPTARQRDLVAGWLRAEGLHDLRLTGGGMALVARGTARQMHHAFGVLFHRYQSGRTQFFANVEPLSLPRPLVSTVLAVTGLNDALRLRSARSSERHAASGPGGGWTPDDIARFYDLRSLHDAGVNGANQTIAVAGFSDVDPGSIKTYDDRFSISGTVTTAQMQDSSCQQVGQNGDRPEVEADVELAQAVAPAANITVYTCANTSAGMALLFEQLVNDDVPVVSTSVGHEEKWFAPADVQALDTAFQASAAQGQTIVAASGNYGAYDGAGNSTQPDRTTVQVDFPASDPWVTGVGATTPQPASDGTYGSETAWSNAGVTPGLGSGGGLSRLFSRPDWQTGPGVDNSYSNGQRQVPDVAAAGATGTYATFTVHGGSASWGTSGGTSAAAPLWAGLVTLLNQKISNASGFLNYMLYSLGQENASLSPPPFHDVTQGTNLYYPATPGWDFATGWGSFDGTVLINTIVNEASGTTTPVSTLVAGATATTTPVSTPPLGATATDTPFGTVVTPTGTVGIGAFPTSTVGPTVTPIPFFIITATPIIGSDSIPPLPTRPTATPSPTMAPTATLTPLPPTITPTTIPTLTLAQARAARVPIRAVLTLKTVHHGSKEELAVFTVPGATITMRVVYPKQGGFTTHGRTNGTGFWRHRWEVHAEHPGKGTIRLLVTHGTDHRNFTVRFKVVGPDREQPVRQRYEPGIPSTR